MSRYLLSGIHPIPSKVVAFLVFFCLALSAQASPACRDDIPDIFDRVSPSVVKVTAVSVNPVPTTDRFQTAIGSGFFFSKEGLVLTNAHVVYGSKIILLTLDNGRTVQAGIIGIDTLLDIAVLQAEEPIKELVIARFIDEKQSVRVGEEVLAFGNPLGLDQTLTRGVVSGINRMWTVSPMSLMVPLIQTDAAINEGNSDGPLVNRCGRVIGMNTSTIALAENIGFAIPASVIREAIPVLTEYGRIPRPWIGIRGQLIEKNLIRELFNIDLDVVDGFLVETVDAGSPAETAGIMGGLLAVKIAGQEILLGGDIIVSMDETMIVDEDSYENAVQSLKVGDTVRIVLYRDGEKLQKEFVLPERPVQPDDVGALSEHFVKDPFGPPISNNRPNRRDDGVIGLGQELGAIRKIPNRMTPAGMR